MKEVQDNSNISAFSAVEEEEGSKLKLGDLFKLCLQYWYWFVISVVLCVGFGVISVKKKTPMYQRTAMIQIRDDDEGSSINSTLANTFADLGVSSASANINNELIAILSPRLLQEVAQRLDLEVSCMTKAGMRKLPVYGTQLPYQINEAEPFKQGLRFRMSAQAGAEQGNLYDFEMGTPSGYQKVDWTYAFNTNSIDTIPTPAGDLIIKPAANYIGDRQPALDLYVSCSTMEGTVRGLKGKIKSALADKDGTVINLTITDSSIKRADDILNTLIEVYNQSWIEDRNQMARATSLFINDRLVDLEAELSNVDTDISSYKSQNLLPDVAAASQLYLQSATRTNEEIQGLRNQLTNARYLRDFISNPANGNTFLPSNSNFDGLSQQLGDYNKLVVERNNLVASSSEKNPRVQLFDAQISDMRSAILAAIDNEIVGLKNSINSLEHAEAGANARLAANPNQAKYLLSVERQQKVKEALYLFLLQKREENELSQAFAPYNSRVLQYASGTGAPISPRPAMTLAMALILGMLIPTGIIYLREMLNTKVRSRRDIEGMDIPFLGEIPQTGPTDTIVNKVLHKKSLVEHGIIVKHGENNVINEAFRMLRTNLEFMTRSEKSGSKVIMITSAIPGSGKTFISENLAAAISLKGSKVLLIDLDLRRHAMSRLLAERARPGASNYLAGRVNDLSSLIAHDIDGHDGLDLLTAGPVPPNPSELMCSDRMADIIDYARSNYDYVIIDCPPSEAVADTRALGNFCDITIYVVRIGYLDRAFLPNIDRMRKENRYPRMSLVINGAETKGVHSYGYGYGYRYGTSKASRK